MIVSYDLEAGATYVELVVDAGLVRTVSVSDLVMVDVDKYGQPVGVEFAVPPARITGDMLAQLADRFPDLKALHDPHTWLLTAA